MKSSADFQIELPTSILILGRPGSGKTTLALQFPKPFVLDCDKNLNGPARYVATKLGKLPWFRYDTPLVDKTGAGVPRPLRMDRAQELLNEALADPEIETIIIDSLTTLIDFIFDKIRATATGLNPPKMADGKKQQDEPLRIQDWGVFASILKQLIFGLKASKKRIVFIGHIVTDKDEVSKILLNFIAVPGQMGNIISGLFEEVWQTEVKASGADASLKAEYKVRTVGDARSEALGLKSAGQIGAYINADAHSIIDKLLTSPVK